MSWCPSPASAPALYPCGFYRQALLALQVADVPFLVGGGHAVAHYVGMTRHTRDLDLFVTPDDCPHTLEVLRTAGYHTELTFPHWLGKVYSGSECIDVIFSSGNSIATVDAAWFAHAVDGRLLGLPVRFCPPEEILWSKSSVMERERYDGADIMHLLHAYGARFDWSRLLGRFGKHWRVLLHYLILFGFVYPARQSCIPTWVMQDLLERLQHELHHPPSADPICQGTLLSRAQYLIDLECWGYRDARLRPTGQMTATEIAQWTAAIAREAGVQ